MKFQKSGSFKGAVEKLNRLQKVAPVQGDRLAFRLGTFFEEEYRTNLEDQGRGGLGPRLSRVTIQLYNYYGWPTGEGIRNHIEFIKVKGRRLSLYGAGVPAGLHGDIALVQEHGATREVNDDVRGYMSVAGVHLSPSTIAIHIPPRRSWSTAVKDTRALARREGAHFFDFLRK